VTAAEAGKVTKLVAAPKRDAPALTIESFLITVEVFMFRKFPQNK